MTFENSQCEYTKTNIPRRKKDVIAAGADSDQEEWVEEAFNQNKEVPIVNPAVPIDADAGKGVVVDAAKQAEKPKKRKVFYYYALRFQFEF